MAPRREARRRSISCIRCFGLECTNLGDKGTVLDVVLRRLAGSTSASLDAITGITTCALCSLLVIAIVFAVCPLDSLLLEAPIAVGLLPASVSVGVCGVGVLFVLG